MNIRVVAFKYYFLYQFLGKVWNEMNLWMRLPPHPNIVPFDRVVIDELHSRVVGFTTPFIPGGTIEDDSTRTPGRGRVFKLSWLKQLTRVVDDLNLRHARHRPPGHRAPQPPRGRRGRYSPPLRYFNYSGRIGDETTGYGEERGDVKGVVFTMYEIITRDNHFRSVPHGEQDIQQVKDVEWVRHPDVRLDYLVSEFRSAVLEWARGRVDGDGDEGGDLSVYTMHQSTSTGKRSRPRQSRRRGWMMARVASTPSGSCLGTTRGGWRKGR